MDNQIISDNFYHATLRNPGKDIGTKNRDKYNIHYYDIELKSIVKGPLVFSDILYNIFDEIITNATDLVIDAYMNNTNLVRNINISYTDDSITIYNDGVGFNVDKGKCEPDANDGVRYWPPESGITRPNTSKHYRKKDRGEESYCGGKNGLGAKLTFIFSKAITVDTTSNGVSYRQTLTLNTNTWKPQYPEPTIDYNSHEENHTTITFYPNFSILLNSSMSDIIPLIWRRALEIKMMLNINVTINNVVINALTPTRFIGQYIVPNVPILEYRSTKTIGEGNTYYWYCAFYPGKNNSVMSYVNGMYTPEGGKHVNYILQHVSKQILAVYNSKRNTLKWDTIRSLLSGIIITYVPNAEYTNQVKGKLKTGKLHPYEPIDNEKIKAFILSGFNKHIEHAIDMANKRLINKSVKEFCSGKRGNRGYGIDKYIPAEYSKRKGWSLRGQTKLFVTEGKSANTSAIEGLKVLKTSGKNLYGTYSMKGKPINAMKCKFDRIANSKEIIQLMTILGLEFDVDYGDMKNFKKLRYGGIIIFTDADEDGTHIKGLIISFFMKYWPSLLQRNDFVYSFRTPYVRIKKGSTLVKEFYSLQQYKNWCSRTNMEIQYKTYYYKGLGTNEPAEMHRYFKDFEKNLVHFVWKEGDGKWIDTAFGKSVAARKTWLKNVTQNSSDTDESVYTSNNLSYETFINKHVNSYVNYNIYRMIPSIIDGFKPVHRKIIYTIIKKNIRSKINVSVLAERVKSNTHYAHGDASMSGAISRMMQLITDVNNLILLQPKGAAGFRDALTPASPRYLGTTPSSYLTLIFRLEDNPILEQRTEEGVSVEYENFIPIIPLILINGSGGIGTAYSTYIPKHHPNTVINILIQRLEANINLTAWDSNPVLIPWYIHYQSNETITSETVKRYGDSYIRYMTYGKYTLLNDILRITELPATGKSYEKYTQGTLKKLLANDVITDIARTHKSSKESNTITAHMPEIYVTLSKTIIETIKSLKNPHDFIIKTFKLSSPINTSNMMGYNSEYKLIKYKTTMEILNEYFKYRIFMYEKRKKYHINHLKDQLSIIQFKLLFIKAIINDRIEIKRVSRINLVHAIDKCIPNIRSTLSTTTTLTSTSYNFLTRMPLYSLTNDDLNKLQTEYDKYFEELNTYKKISISQLWLNELHELKRALQ